MIDNSKIQRVINIYIEANNKISEILKDEPDLLLRNETVLSKLINSLKHSIGSPINIDKLHIEQKQKKTLEYIFGRKLGVVEQHPISTEELIPKDIEMEKLKRSVEALYETIENRENNEILGSNDDLHIRALAKKMGIEYSKEKVPRLNAHFINDLKTAVREHKQQAAQEQLVKYEMVLDFFKNKIQKLGLTIIENDANITITKGAQILAELAKEEFIQMTEENFDSLIQAFEDKIGDKVNENKEIEDELNEQVEKPKRKPKKVNSDR